MLEIKIVGMGCSKCQKLEQTARESLEGSGLQGNVIKVMDPVVMAGLGVTQTPALVLNGAVKSSGRLPTRAQVDTWFREAAT